MKDRFTEALRNLAAVAVLLALGGVLAMTDIHTSVAQEDGAAGEAVITAEDAETTVQVEGAEAITETGVPVADQGVVVDPSVISNAVTSPVAVFTVLAGIAASFITSLLSKPGWSPQIKMGVWLATSALLAIGYQATQDFAAEPIVIKAAGVATVAIAFYRLNHTSMVNLQQRGVK